MKPFADNGSDPEDQQGRSSVPCKCFSQFHAFFRQGFFNLGYYIGSNPSYFIIIPVFLTLLGLTGLQNIKLEKDPDYLFVPTDSVSKYTRDTIEELFPLNSSQRFDPSRITRAGDFAKLLITTKDNGTMMRMDVWDEFVLLDNIIQNFTIEHEGETFNYTQLCSKWENRCFPNLIYNLNEVIYEVENGSLTVSYPVMLFPLVLPLFYGGPIIDEENGLLLYTRGAYTTYFLAHDNLQQQQRSYLWEGKLLELLDSIEFEHIQIDRYASRSLKEELAKNGEYLMNFLPIAVVLLFVFSLVTVSSSDWVRSKTQMSILGLFTIIMAVVASFGSLMYLGVPYIPINSAVPFLILGIGLDDMYILLSSWRKTPMQNPVPKRLAETYADTAISVTITSLTTLVSFFIGTTSSFPAASIFCIYLGTSVLVTYVWFLTFFGSCLAIVGHLEKNQKHVVSCRSVQSKSQSATRPLYYFWCAGGINSEDPWNILDNKPDSISKFFRDFYGRSLTKPIVKVLVILIYMAYLGGAIYGSFQIQQGVDRKNFGLDGSYLTKFYQTEDELFRKFPYRIQVIIKGNLSFHEEPTKQAIVDIHKAVESLPFIGLKLYTRSWMRGFYNYLQRRPALQENITDEISFIKVLQNNYLMPSMQENLDIRFNANKTKIEATRFIVQAYEVHSMEEDFKMVEALRAVADNSSLDVYVYHPTFVYYDQYLVVGPSALKIVCLTAFILILISLFFIPNPISTLFIGLSIISINFGIVGYMSLWDVRLDTVALVNLIICIGFSVDYSAHVSYSFLSSTAKTSQGKISDCLYRMGLPVLQSGVSTFLAIIVFIFTPSYIYRTFFKILFLVIIFGMIHSLVILPVMLSLFCRDGEGGVDEDDTDDAPKLCNIVTKRNSMKKSSQTNSKPPLDHKEVSLRTDYRPNAIEQNNKSGSVSSNSSESSANYSEAETVSKKSNNSGRTDKFLEHYNQIESERL